MPRVVERDHRSEELRYLGWEVVEPDVGIRAVDVRMTTGEVDIVELRHRPVAGAVREPGRCRLAPKRDRRLAPQRGERPVADVVVFQPELQGAQIDIGKRNLGRGNAVHPRRNAHDDRSHLNEGATIGERNGKRPTVTKTLRLLQLRQDAICTAALWEGDEGQTCRASSLVSFFIGHFMCMSCMSKAHKEIDRHLFPRGADGVRADVLGRGRAAAVAVEAGERVGAARLQRRPARCDQASAQYPSPGARLSRWTRVCAETTRDRGSRSGTAPRRTSGSAAYASSGGRPQAACDLFVHRPGQISH